MDRVMLSQEEAEAMLPGGDEIHTFRQGGPGMLIGADWDRIRLIEHMKKYEPVELSGEIATNMGHGMVLQDGNGFLFIATKSAPH